MPYAKLFPIALFLLLNNATFAQVSPNEVKPGNPLRKTILNTIRTPTEAELGQKVEFMVNTAMSKGNWAFVYGQLQQPGGKTLRRRVVQRQRLPGNGAKWPV